MPDLGRPCRLRLDDRSGGPSGGWQTTLGSGPTTGTIKISVVESLESLEWMILCHPLSACLQYYSASS